jgi:hypothetical protein
MDGHAANADNAESGDEASPSAGGKADGRFAQTGEFTFKEKRAARRSIRRAG